MKKLFVILLALVMMMSTSVFAIEPIQTEEMEIASFLNEKDISLSLIDELKDVYDTTNNEGKVVIGNFNDKIIEIKNLAETYNFSKEQIEDYIEGIISKPPAIVGAFESAELFTSVTGTGVAVSSTNTNQYNRGRFGKWGDDYKQVKVNDYNPWDGEDVDIFFDATKQNVGE